MRSREDFERFTIYRAATRLKWRRCLFSYEVFAIRRRRRRRRRRMKHRRRRWRRAKRASEQARCSLVESERRLNRLPVHFCCLRRPAEGGGPPCSPPTAVPSLPHRHLSRYLGHPAARLLTLLIPFPRPYPPPNASSLPIHIAASATLCALRPLLRLLSFSLVVPSSLRRPPTEVARSLARSLSVSVPSRPLFSRDSLLPPPFSSLFACDSRALSSRLFSRPPCASSFQRDTLRHPSGTTLANYANYLATQYPFKPPVHTEGTKSRGFRGR